MLPRRPSGEPEFITNLEMIYPENFEQKISFDTIRASISEKCLCPIGAEKVAGMHFSTDYNITNQWLMQTDEFLDIIQQKENFPTDYFLDIRSTLHQIDNDPTAWLSEKEIPLLANSLETIRQIVAFINRAHISTGQVRYPELKKMADKISLFPSIIAYANTILDKSGQIKDNATHSLSEIRKNKIETKKEITRSMQVAIRHARAQGLIGNDVEADMRGGYYLIPVAASNKRKIKGVVRDNSGSGKTVYMEPEAVVEASNRLRELENDERREIVRILIEFTNLVRPAVVDLLISYDFMGDVDFIRAKALFAVRIRGIKPVFENLQQIEWRGAIHPLLDITLRQRNENVHPLDIRLCSEDRILLVSGPNAGGKSLCLKTVALLQYMLQCGLLIPVAPHSKAGIFERIFMDIGDGQSLENSLSTYTAHLTAMKFFVENVNDKTLLLIDEFGGGTEPQIGGAIAETLLDRFNSRRSFGLITTHFQNLKHFAYSTTGITNGAMLYDSENLRPLYKLSIGHPGSSFAIEVARRIGLPEGIISEASNKLGDNFINMDNLLQSIARDKLYWESKRKEMEIYTYKNEEPKKVQISVPIQTAEFRVKERTVPVIRKGDQVCLQGQLAVGTVLEVTDKMATVAFGSIKSKIALNRLNLKSPGDQKPESYD